jgi:hypothetical protein
MFAYRSGVLAIPAPHLFLLVVGNIYKINGYEKMSSCKMPISKLSTLIAAAHNIETSIRLPYTSHPTCSQTDFPISRKSFTGASASFHQNISLSVGTRFIASVIYHYILCFIRILLEKFIDKSRTR